MEHHHFSWENSLEMAIVNSYLCMFTRRKVLKLQRCPFFQFLGNIFLEDLVEKIVYKYINSIYIYIDTWMIFFMAQKDVVLKLLKLSIETQYICPSRVHRWVSTRPRKFPSQTTAEGAFPRCSSGRGAERVELVRTLGI